jgi:hypothetical protein
MPAGFAIGALSFFLQVASLSLKSTQTSSQKNLSKKQMMKIAKETPLFDTGDGLRLLHYFSKSSILNFTGDKTITDLKVPFVFNYLSFERDKNVQEQKALKAQQQSYKIK